MIQAISSALTGLTAYRRQMDAAAANIARAGTHISKPTGGTNLPGDIVDLLVARRGFEANLVTVRTADEMLGSLLDVWS